MSYENRRVVASYNVNIYEDDLNEINKQLGKQNPKKNFFSHQMKLLVLKMACILLSIWSNSSHKNPQTTQVINKAIGCSPQIDN